MDDIVFSNESLEKSGKIFKKIVNGEPKNVNPLKTYPKSQMTLYGIYGHYFETEKELQEYCKKSNFPFDKTYILEFLGNVAGKKDVIRESNRTGRFALYTVIDEDGYAVYNKDRSFYRGEFVWEYNYGDIREMYKAFRDKGIEFENDVYKKVDDLYQKIFKKTTKYIQNHK